MCKGCDCDDCMVLCSCCEDLICPDKVIYTDDDRGPYCSDECAEECRPKTLDEEYWERGMWYRDFL